MEYLVAVGVIVAVIPGILGFLKFRNYLFDLSSGGEDILKDFKQKSILSLAIMFTGAAYLIVISMLFISYNAPRELFYIPLYMGFVSFATNFGRYFWLDQLFEILRRKNIIFGRPMIFLVIFESNLIYSLLISIMLWGSYVGPSAENTVSIPASYYIFQVLPIGYTLIVISAIVQGLVVRNVLKDPDALGKKFGISITKSTIPHIISILGLAYIIYSMIPVLSYETAGDYLHALTLLLKSFH